MPSSASSWTCSRCHMSVRYLAGFPAPDAPEGWGKEAGALHCLNCRRELAATVAAVGADPCSPAEQRKVRQRALAEFELCRDPDRRDAVIANAAHTSRILVTKTRVALRAAGRLRDARN